jgi:HD-GYP domain-containing protein (c-di-GMP phosphodiesterase class II)
MNFRSGCEAADVLAARLGMAQPVRDALACTFERWNGKGQPNRVKGEQIPLPMRIVHLAQDAEALTRLRSPGEAVTVIRKRSGHAYDPALVDEFVPVAAEAFARLDKADPWDAAYAKGMTAGQLNRAARILGAADRYQAMTQHRAHRPALSPQAAGRRTTPDGRGTAVRGRG